MAAITELESFVQKFKQLWKSGHDARLALETKAGKASVALHLQLGDEPGPIHDGRERDKTFVKHKNNPARERRRVRRSEIQKRNCNPSVESNVAEKVDTEKVDMKLCDEDKSIVDSEVFEESFNVKLETNAVAEKASEKERGQDQHTEINVNDKIITLEKSEDHIRTVAAEEAVEECQDSQKGVCENNDDVVVTAQEDAFKVSTEYVKDEKAGNNVLANDNSKKGGESEIATIFATAVISNSNSSQVTPENISALSSILKNKDHLCRNISYLNYRSHGTLRLSNGNYEHSVQIEMDVKTGNLWESARSYIYHHLGRDVWTLNDGPSISILRIHQKR